MKHIKLFEDFLNENFKGFKTLPDVYPPRDKNGMYNDNNQSEWFNLDLFLKNIKQVLETEGYSIKEPKDFDYVWVDLYEVEEFIDVKAFLDNIIIAKYPKMTGRYDPDKRGDIANDLIKKTQLIK